MILIVVALMGWGLFLLTSSLLGSVLWGEEQAEEQATDAPDHASEDPVTMRKWAIVWMIFVAGAALLALIGAGSETEDIPSVQEEPGALEPNQPNQMLKKAA